MSRSEESESVAPRSGLRLFVEADLSAGADIVLAEGQAHYLRSVMRRSPGAPLRLFNGRDGEWAATLAELGKRRALARVEAPLRPQAPEPDLWLLFAPVKRAATDLIAQKATELGVSALHPVFTAHTDSQRVNADRLRVIAAEAAEQCGRLSVPAIAEARPLEAALAGWPRGRRLVLCDESGTAPPAMGVLAALEPAAPGALLIGPEGGFAEGELDRLRKLEFVTPIALGPRVLRAPPVPIFL